MKVLIIGGNSYLARTFAGLYHDKLSFKVLKRDATLKDYFDLTLDDFRGFDAVVNFSAIVHNKKADKQKHKKYNYELVKHLAQLSKQAGVGQFVQISTIAVYGDLTQITDKSEAVAKSAYGAYKLQADNFLKSLSSDGFKTAILRPPVIYGKDAPGNMQSLTKLLSLGIPLPLGYHHNSRSILSVKNFSHALFLVLKQKSEGVFLLRDADMPSIGELSREISKRLPRAGAILSMPAFVVKLLLKSGISTFYKLYGDVIIDDTQTKKRIGEYCVEDWRSAIGKH